MKTADKYTFESFDLYGRIPDAPLSEAPGREKVFKVKLMEIPYPGSWLDIVDAFYGIIVKIFISMDAELTGILRLSVQDIQAFFLIR